MDMLLFPMMLLNNVFYFEKIYMKHKHIGKWSSSDAHLSEDFNSKGQVYILDFQSNPCGNY